MFDKLISDSDIYLSKLSGTYRNLINVYTSNSSIINNNSVQMGLFFKKGDFNLDSKYRLDILKLQSVILNAPICDKDVVLHNFFSENLSVPLIVDRCSVKFIPIEESKTSDSILNIIFTSTTIDESVLKYMDLFLSINKDHVCCYREIIIPSGIPMIYVGNISSYPWQKEVILPIGLSTIKTAELSGQINLYKNAMGKVTITKNPGLIDIKNMPDSTTWKPEQYNVNKIETNANNVFIDRIYIDHLNTILSDYTLNYSHHNAIHACIVISTSIILLNNIINNPTKNQILEVIYTSLYHDVGRKGVDGPDFYEELSRQLVLDDDILLDLFNVDFRDRISRRIVEKLTDDIYYAYKGADSLDFPSCYKDIYNPIYKKYAGKKCLDSIISENEEKSLYNEINFLRSVIRCIVNKDIGFYFDDYENAQFEYEDRIINVEEYNTFAFLYKTKEYDMDLLAKSSALESDYIGDDPLNFIEIFNVRKNLMIATNPETYNASEYITEFLGAIEGIKEICSEFINLKYLTDVNRIFDDYWQILSSIMPFMYIHFTSIFSLFIPFRPTDLFEQILS